MVGAPGIALPNVAGASGVSLSVPSGVVTQTCAVTPAGACAAAALAGPPAVATTVTPAARAVPSEAAMSLILAIFAIPSCNKMKQNRNFVMPGSEPVDPLACQGFRGPYAGGDETNACN